MMIRRAKILFYSSTTSHLKYFTHTELMSNIQRYANCINISRGSTSHIVRKMQNILKLNEIFYNQVYIFIKLIRIPQKLDGPDPSSTRPRWLYVKTLTPELITETEVLYLIIAINICIERISILNI